MYYRKMVGYIGNEKLLIHCFQDSLIGSAEWYVRLDRIYIRSWNDLAKAFVDHYKHVVDANRIGYPYKIWSRDWMRVLISIPEMVGSDNTSATPTH